VYRMAAHELTSSPLCAPLEFALQWKHLIVH
jgi:hypothetical protein